MKKKLSHLFLSVFCLGVIGFAQDVKANSTCKELIVSAHPDAPPVMYRDGMKIEGIGVDIARLIAQKLDIPLKSKYVGPWKRALRVLEKGEIDLITSLYKTQKRQQVYEYTSMLMADPVSVVTARENPLRFQKWEDLIGLKGAAVLGDSYGDEFDTFIKSKLNVSRLTGYELILKQLQQGRADYMIAPLYTIRANALRYGFVDKIHIQETLVTTENLYMAFSKHSPCLHLKADFDRLLVEMQQNGEVDALIERAIAKWSSRKG